LFALKELYSHSVVKAIPARRFQNPALQLYPTLQHFAPQSASPTASNQSILPWSRIGNWKEFQVSLARLQVEIRLTGSHVTLNQIGFLVGAMSRTVTLGPPRSEKKSAMVRSN
jgi:hypothetical protein